MVTLELHNGNTVQNYNIAICTRDVHYLLIHTHYIIIIIICKYCRHANIHDYSSSDDGDLIHTCVL